MIAGEEKNMMGAQQAGRQSDRQEPACSLLRPSDHHSSDHQIKAKKKKEKKDSSFPSSFFPLLEFRFS